GCLFRVDARAMRFRELKLRKTPDCVICGPRPTVTKLIDYEAFCGIGPEPVDAGVPEISVEGLAARRRRGDPFVRPGRARAARDRDLRAVGLDAGSARGADRESPPSLDGGRDRRPLPGRLPERQGGPAA